VITCRDFKRVEADKLCQALDAACQWSDLYIINDVNKSLSFIMRGINVALDTVATLKDMTVKKGNNLNLAAGTLELMKAQDAAARAGDRNNHKYLRNKVMSRVRRDRLRTNMARLAKFKGDSRVVWQVANDTVGNNSPSLPAYLESNGGREVCGKAKTTTDLEAANVQNKFYIDKVAKLKEAVRKAPPPPPSCWTEKSTTFEWTYMSEGKVAKLIRGLGSTEALGVDGVPVSVYKKGLDILSGPIAHLVNRSLASGHFPKNF
jgi:hypothetical protein